jgi:tRNA threonylcarbamoyladenosine biosynthesis protein TsaE
MKRSWEIQTAEHMEQLGTCLAPGLTPGMTVYFEGELGAGKTTLIRGLLRGLGCTEAVTSPTFTLVEPYAFPQFVVYHVDLYRLEDPAEIEALALREQSGVAVLLIEWPNRARDMLPEPDAVLRIKYRDGGRSVSLTTAERGQPLGAQSC